MSKCQTTTQTTGYQTAQLFYSIKTVINNIAGYQNQSIECQISNIQVKTILNKKLTTKPTKDQKQPVNNQMLNYSVVLWTLFVKNIINNNITHPAGCKILKWWERTAT